MAMKSVRIAQLKDHLSEHLRAVEAGEEVLVMDRERPIARIVPMAPAAYAPRLIPPVRSFAPTHLRVVPADLGISSTELLLEERGDR
jgi:prevent-host-death family protein